MTMGLSISLVGYLFAYPLKVAEIFRLQQPVEPELLVRWFLPGWLLFLGLAIAHIWFVRISSKTSKQWILHDKVTLPIGNYYDVIDKDGKKILKITIKGISEEDMPPPYEHPKNHRPEPYRAEAATLSFDPFFVFPGSYVKKVEISPFSDESQFALAKNTYSEESNSVFFFRTETTTGDAQFFRCFVSHINLPKQEVELDIYFLQV